MASPPTRMKPDTGGEATGKHSPGLPGWLGAARVDRSVEDLFALARGRPCREEAQATNGRREDITDAAALKGVGEAHTSEEAG